jgi:hypothetical protein
MAQDSVMRTMVMPVDGGIIFLSLCAASLMVELAHAHARVDDVAEPLALMAPTGPHNTKTGST